MTNPINNHWVFGNNAGLDFSSSPPNAPDATDGFNMTTGEGCASISDQNGDLLFYTDGSTVWDHQNGNSPISGPGLDGNSSSTQSSIIVPKPDSSTEYYIFTADGSSGTDNHLSGILLDYPTWSNSPITGFEDTTGFSATEKVTAVQHSNCRDFWILSIIVKGSDPDGDAYFRIYLLDSTGLHHQNDYLIDKPVHDLGYLKASIDGSQIAVANWENSNVLYFPFDNSTGIVDTASMEVIDVPPLDGNENHKRRTYGVEFSPNNELLYFTVIGNSTGQNLPENIGYIYQVEINNSFAVHYVDEHEDSDINPSVRDGYALGALQLGVDDKIYIAIDGERKVGAIKDPNNQANPDVDFNYIDLEDNSVCNLGLPNLLPNACLDDCKKICDEVDAALHEKCLKKVNELEPCEGEKNCDCNNGQDCVSLEIPKIEPCISIKWGDDECDCLETDDTEVLCITVCNCYSNITMKDVKICKLEVVDENGNAPAPLPDGSPSVALYPMGPFCFGDLEPCGRGNKNCVSREFVLINKAALPGIYQIKVSGICFDVCFHYDSSQCFQMKLCKD